MTTTTATTRGSSIPQQRNNGILQESPAEEQDEGLKRDRIPGEDCATSRKRFKEHQHRLASPMDNLPDSILKDVFGWVGKSEYLFVAPVERRFRYIYRETFGTETLYTTAFSTIPRAKLSCAEYGLDYGICRYAAEGGHLEVLKWARSQGCRWDILTCACAAKSGHLEV